MSPDAVVRLTEDKTPRTTFGWGWVIVLVFVVLWMLAPRIEEAIWPFRNGQQIADLHREPPGWIRFTWISEKHRSGISNNVDVFLTTRDNLYNVAIYSEKTPAGAEPCSVVVPWARSSAVSVGHQEQKFCIEIPRPVPPSEPISVKIIAHYDGFWGLWDVPLTLPPINVPGV